MKIKYKLLSVIALLCLGIASEAWAIECEKLGECVWSGWGCKCTSCNDGYEFYNAGPGMSCGEICTDGKERIRGICQKTICDSNEEKVDGVCVTIPTCEKGGSACREKTGKLIENCCYKMEKNKVIIYPDNSTQDYSIGNVSLDANDIIIEAGLRYIWAGGLCGNYNSIQIPDNATLRSPWCDGCNNTNINELIVPDTVRVEHPGCQISKITCLGDIDKCKANVYSDQTDKVVAPTKEQCNSSGSYYYTGSECIKRPMNGTDITCDHEYSGYVKVGNYCASPEDTYAKKRYTPAEAAQWLYEDNNTITLTFKK